VESERKRKAEERRRGSASNNSRVATDLEPMISTLTKLTSTVVMVWVCNALRTMAVLATFAGWCNSSSRLSRGVGWGVQSNGDNPEVHGSTILSSLHCNSIDNVPTSSKKKDVVIRG